MARRSLATRLQDAVFGTGPAKKPAVPKLKELAKQIEQDFPDLVAIVYPANHPLGGYCNTDRKIGRLRHPGKGRRGSRLVVSWRPGHGPICMDGDGTKYERHVFLGPGGNRCQRCDWDRSRVVFEHNAAETYRTNQDVVNWINRRKAGR